MAKSKQAKKGNQAYLFEDKLREGLDKLDSQDVAIKEYNKKTNLKKATNTEKRDIIIKELRTAMRDAGVEEQKVTMTNGEKKIISFKEVLQITDDKEETANIPGTE